MKLPLQLCPMCHDFKPVTNWNSPWVCDECDAKQTWPTKLMHGEDRKPEEVIEMDCERRELQLEAKEAEYMFGRRSQSGTIQ